MGLVGFAARTRVSDPAFNDDPDRIDILLTKAYGDKIFENMTDVCDFSLR